MVMLMPMKWLQARKTLLLRGQKVLLLPRYRVMELFSLCGKIESSLSLSKDRWENNSWKLQLIFLLLTLKMCNYFLQVLCTLLDQLCILKTCFTELSKDLVNNFCIVCFLYLPLSTQNTVQFFGQCWLQQISMQWGRQDIQKLTMKEPALSGLV